MRGWIHTGLAVLCIALSFAPRASGVDLVPDWESLPFNPYPLAPAVPIEPVLTAEDVTDEPTSFIADPFLFHEGNVWHMFFEVYSRLGYRGKIGHATSPDGLQWSYDRIVLADSTHLAFPYVFEVDGTHYMLMCPTDTHLITLYAAHDFPYDWRFERTLLGGRPYVDPVIIRHDDLWWLFAGQSSSGYCYLFYAYSLSGGWVEHPMSPIVDDLGKGRPAGRPFVYGNGRVVRLAQKNNQRYGQAVRAFEVDVLTRATYAEHEIPESPILHDSGQGWNAAGMHTCDAWWDGNHWLASVDGIDELFTIGIYRTAVPSGVEGPQRSSVPNPFQISTWIPYETPAGASSLPVRLALYASDGRLVRVLADRPLTVGPQGIAWDGRDARGEPVPSGMYFYRLESGEQIVTGRMVRAR